MTDPIEIFRAGTFTDMAGITRTWTAADVAAIAANYDPDRHEAPVVIGHPATDAPAYAWVERLDAVGDTLRAVFRQVDEGFRELVRAGRFKKISAALLAPEHPNNPSPGAWSLRHVGFLGAAPPAVKGLRPAMLSVLSGAYAEAVMPAGGPLDGSALSEAEADICAKLGISQEAFLATCDETDEFVGLSDVEADVCRKMGISADAFRKTRV